MNFVMRSVQVYTHWVLSRFSGVIVIVKARSKEPKPLDFYLDAEDQIETHVIKSVVSFVKIYRQPYPHHGALNSCSK